MSNSRKNIVNNPAAQLCSAAFDGKIDIVMQLIKDGADVNQARNDGATPLFIAAQQGQKEIAELLIAKGADVNQACKDGATPIYIAAQQGHIEIIERLIANGADVNQACKDGATPLFIAAQEWHTQVFMNLLAHTTADKIPDNYNHFRNDYLKEDILAYIATLPKKQQLDLYNQALQAGTPLHKIMHLSRGLKACRSGYGIIGKIEARQKTTTEAIAEANQALHDASRSGDFEKAVAVLQNADVNHVDQDGYTALHIALLNAQIEIAKLLIAKGANVCQVNKNSVSPLFIAAQEGHTEIAQLLIANGADVNQAYKDGATPLFIAAQQGHAEAGKILIENRADVTLSFKTTKSSMMKFISSRKNITNDAKKRAENLISKYETEEIEITPAQIANIMGHDASVRLLRANGAYANPVNKDAENPLFSAIALGAIKSVEQLITDGAYVNQVDRDGYTPLLTAIDFGRTKISERLIAAGADVNQTDKDGVTPLGIAAMNGHKEIVELLIAAGADLNQVDIESGLTPLILALGIEHKEIAERLITAGADVNIAGHESGGSPLYIAVGYGYTEIAEMLIAAGADVNQTEKHFGATPLFLAAEEGHTETVKLLIANNADATLKINMTKSELNQLVSEMDDTKNLIKERASSYINLYHGEETQITAAEIAHIMGHDEIAALINEHVQNKQQPVTQEQKLTEVSALSVMTEELDAITNHSYLCIAGDQVSPEVPPPSYAEATKNDSLIDRLFNAAPAIAREPLQPQVRKPLGTVVPISMSFDDSIPTGDLLGFGSLPQGHSESAYQEEVNQALKELVEQTPESTSNDEIELPDLPSTLPSYGGRVSRDGVFGDAARSNENVASEKAPAKQKAAIKMC